MLVNALPKLTMHFLALITSQEQQACPDAGLVLRQRRLPNVFLKPLQRAQPERSQIQPVKDSQELLKGIA